MKLELTIEEKTDLGTLLFCILENRKNLHDEFNSSSVVFKDEVFQNIEIIYNKLFE